MEILPLVGIGELEFGQRKKAVLKLLGTPSTIINENGLQDEGYEKWEYNDLGIELSFENDGKQLLISITVESEVACLNGFNPVGQNEASLIQSYPEIELTNQHEGRKKYIFPNKGIELFLRDNKVKRIYLDPNLNEFIDKTGPKRWIRQKTNRRLVIDDLRSAEKTLAIEMSKSWLPNNTPESNLWDIDLKWFFSSRFAIDVFDESMWCDGVEITLIKFISDHLMYVECKVDLMSSNDGSFNQICVCTGYLQISTRLELQSYLFNVLLNDKTFIAKKGKGYFHHRNLFKLNHAIEGFKPLLLRTIETTKVTAEFVNE